MEIFAGTYMRSRLSPLLSLKPEVEKVKIRLFGCFRLIFSFLIFALLTKNWVAFARVQIRFRTGQ
jgi:hypothetical protein